MPWLTAPGEPGLLALQNLVLVDVVREGGGFFSSFVDPVQSQRQSISTGGIVGFLQRHAESCIVPIPGE